MKRLALPVVLSVVFATSGSQLFAACGGQGCSHARSSNCGCQESCEAGPPVYYNTEFPGTCRECKDEFAFSLWADYCQTKRSGPAYRLPRRSSCFQCGPAAGGACEVNHGNAGSYSYPTEATAAPQQQVQSYPTPAEGNSASDLRYKDAVELKADEAELSKQAEAPVKPEAPTPPEPAYYGAPQTDDAGEKNVAAEVDESTMPTDIGVNDDLPPSRQEAEEAIRRSVDDAIERALKEGSSEAPQPPAETIDDRSAKRRPSLFRLFRPRSR